MVFPGIVSISPKSVLLKKRNVEFAPVLIFVGLLVFLSHLFVALFERTRVPDVLYLILIGVIIGPVLHVVSPLDFGKVGHVFTTIALVVILFEGGLELGFEHLRAAFRSTLVLTMVSYLLAFVVLSGVIFWLMDLPVLLSFFVAAVLASPAPAVVLPLVRQLPLTQSSRTVLTLESPLGEALGIVLALAFLESIRFESVQVGYLIGKLMASFAFALVIGGVGGFGWSVLLHRIRQLRFAIFTTPAFLLVLFGVTEFLGFSGPVTALTFGVTLANAGTKEFPRLARRYNLTPLEHNDTERAFFGEIGFLIKTFFFVFVGLSATLVDVWTLTIALALTVALLLSRILATRLSTAGESTLQKDALLMSVMIPKGTAAAVLASIPLQLMLDGGNQVQHVIDTVVVVSIVATAALLFLVEKTPVGRFLAIPFLRYRKETVVGEFDAVPSPGNPG
jgi:Na+:H+ antiporter